MDNTEQTAQAKAAAELITPRNKLKEAVGSGGLDTSVIKKAQSAMEVTASVTDFRPIARELLGILIKAYEAARAGTFTSHEDAIEAMIHPAMQMKAQGGMFKYSLITDVCNILVNFLETAEKVDAKALDIVEAHIKTITLVINRDMKGDGAAPGKALREALMDACNRFYRARMAASV